MATSASPGALITRRGARSLLAPRLATCCRVPTGASQAPLLSGPWGLNIPGEEHQPVSLWELEEEAFFTFTLRYNVDLITA